MRHLLALVAILTIITPLVNAQNDNCVLNVPNNPLSAEGLTTLWTLSGINCNQANLTHSRFVHAVILNTDTGALSLYNPLVVTVNTMPAAPPAPVKLPQNFEMVIYLGSNSNFLTLGNSQGIAAGVCTVGTTVPQPSPFGQFGFCNVDKFWAKLMLLRNAGLVMVPAPGIAKDGVPCSTLRDYFITDMDPSDGVQTVYLVTNGLIMQKTQKNMNANPNNFAEIANDGDNRLITKFVHPAIGCGVWTIPDLADPGVTRPANVLNLLQAASYAPLPWCTLPALDPMTTTNGAPDLAKINLYKTGVYEQPILNMGEADTTHFCESYAAVAVPRFKNLANLLKNFPSPAPPATNLFMFMIARASATWTMLNCVGLTTMPDPFPNIAAAVENAYQQVKPLAFNPLD